MTFPFSYDHFDRGAARRSERVKAGGSVRLLQEGRPDLQVELVDVSAEGFLIACDQPLAIGSAIWIDIPSVRLISGRVVWQKDGRVGGEFSHRLKWRALQRFRLADESRRLRPPRRGRIFR